MIPLPIRSHAVLSARSYLELTGSRETPDASNQGFWIDNFKVKFGGGKNWAWCMYTVQALFDEAYEYTNALAQCMLNPIIDADLIQEKLYTAIMQQFKNPFDEMPMHQRGHCMSVWRFAKGNDRLSIIPAPVILAGEKIPRYSIFVIGRPDDTGHTGLVIEHKQNDADHRLDVIKTIEGNKSNRIDTGKYTLAALIAKGFKGVIY